MPLVNSDFKNSVSIEPLYDGVVMLSPEVVFFNDAQPRPDGRKFYHIFEHTPDELSEDESLNKMEDFSERKWDLFSKASANSMQHIQDVLQENGIPFNEWCPPVTPVMESKSPVRDISSPSSQKLENKSDDECSTEENYEETSRGAEVFIEVGIMEKKNAPEQESAGEGSPEGKWTKIKEENTPTLNALLVKDHPTPQENKLENQPKSEKKKFYCSICNFYTIYKGNMKKHKLIHFKSKPLKVQKSLEHVTSNPVKVQESLEHKIKVLQCAECSFSATSRVSFKYHVLSHSNTNVYPFKCSLCNFQTKYKCNLKQHEIRIHKVDHSKIGVSNPKNKVEESLEGINGSLMKRERLPGGDSFIRDLMEEKNDSKAECDPAEKEVYPVEKAISSKEINPTTGKAPFNMEIDSMRKSDCTKFNNSPEDISTPSKTLPTFTNNFPELKSFQKVCPEIGFREDLDSSAELNSTTFLSSTKEVCPKEKVGLMGGKSLTKESTLSSHSIVKLYRCSFCSFWTKYKFNLKTHEIRIHKIPDRRAIRKARTIHKIKGDNKKEDVHPSKQNCSAKEIDPAEKTSSTKEFGHAENVNMLITDRSISSTENEENFEKQEYVSAEHTRKINKEKNSFAQGENKINFIKENMNIIEGMGFMRTKHTKKTDLLNQVDSLDKTGSTKESDLTEHIVPKDKNSPLIEIRDINVVCPLKQLDFRKNDCTEVMHSIKNDLKRGMNRSTSICPSKEDDDDVVIASLQKVNPTKMEKYPSNNDHREEGKGVLRENLTLMEDDLTLVKDFTEKNSLMVDFSKEMDSQMEEDPLLEKDPLIDEDFLMENDQIKKNLPIAKGTRMKKDPTKKKLSVDKDLLVEKDSLMGKGPLIVKYPLMEKDPLVEEDPLMVKDSLLEEDPLKVEEPLIEEDPLMECEPFLENDSMNNHGSITGHSKKGKDLNIEVPEKERILKNALKNEKVLKKEKLLSMYVPKIHMNPVVLIHRLKENGLHIQIKSQLKSNGKMTTHVKENIKRIGHHEKGVNLKKDDDPAKESDDKKQYKSSRKTSVKSFECQKCDFITYSKRTLRQHCYIHLKAKAHKCSHCAYSTNIRASLKQHQFTHLDTKMFKCSVCNYGTNFKGNLKVHEMNHLHIRKYKCKHCTFSTNLRNHFKLHKVHHLELSELKCFHCHFQTDCKSVLRKHLRIHRERNTTKPKVFECQKCWFLCNSQSGLKQHELTHLDFKIYHCSLCEYETNYRANLLKHLLNHEANNDLGVALPKQDT